MASISVIGAGIWKTALVILLSDNGHQAIIWSAVLEEVRELERTHTRRNLSDLHIPEPVGFTEDLKEVVEDRNLSILTVPSVFMCGTAQKMKSYIKEGQAITNVAKGIEGNTLMTLPQIIEEELPEAEVTVFSGPSHVEEVSRGLPITCVAGIRKKHVVEFVQGIFMSQVFRVYTGPDILGVELDGVLESMIALASSMVDGLGYGDNTKAALITRGIAEISRPGTDMGGRTETFIGLTGIGDLIITCASVHSRNQCTGILIGKGYTMEEVMAEVNVVVEGVYSAKTALALSRQYHVPMPIVEQVNVILFGGMPAEEAVLRLMFRDKRVESSGLEWEEERDQRVKTNIFSWNSKGGKA